MFRYYNFKLIGQNFSGIPTIWSYFTDDTIDMITAEGYFDDPRLEVEPVDIVEIQCSEGAYTIQINGTSATIIASASATQKINDMPDAEEVSKLTHATSIAGLDTAQKIAKALEQSAAAEYKTLIAPLGLADYTSHFNELSDYNIHIPPGEWPITGNVAFNKSVRCDGVIVTSGSGADKPRIVLGNSYIQTAVDATTLTGLTRGSSNIPELTGKKGHVVTIVSTEVASKRFGLTGEYLKEEVCVIQSDSGDIWPPLMHTYTDTTLMTVTTTPPPPATKIEGLNLRCDYVGVDNDIITVDRHNCTIESLKLHAADSQNELTFQGCHVANSFNIKFNNPEISGFLNENAAPERLGYGINCRRSSNINITNGIMYNNKHSVDALNSKAILVQGGFYTSAGGYPVGAHYADDLKVLDVTINCLGGDAVGFSGGSIAVKNCKLNNCDRSVLLRTDVPEIFGHVEILDNEIKFEGISEQAFIGSSSISNDYGTYFGREINWPANINISGNRYLTKSALLRIVRFNTKTYDRTAIGGLSFTDNKLFNNSSYSVNYVTTSNLSNTVEFNISDYATSDINPKITIKNNESINTLTIYVTAENDNSAPYKFSVDVENSGAIDYRIDVDALNSFKQFGGQVDQIRTATVLNGGDTVRSESFFYELDNVKFKAACTLWRATNRIIAKNSEFIGDVSFSTDAYNPQTISTTRDELFIFSNGNIATASADPARLPALNNHYEPSIFQV